MSLMGSVLLAGALAFNSNTLPTSKGELLKATAAQIAAEPQGSTSRFARGSLASISAPTSIGGPVEESRRRQYSNHNLPNPQLSSSMMAGALVLDLPLTLPRGPGGLAPRLSFSYDSHLLRNSELGVGWYLNLARIEKKELKGVESFDLMHGNSSETLVEVARKAELVTYVLPTGDATDYFFYRPGTSDWEHLEGGGAISVFGRHPSLRRPNGSADEVWFLESTTSPYGDQIVFSYGLSGDLLTLQGVGYSESRADIELSRTADGGIARLCEHFHYCLAFDWENRPDRIVRGRAGRLFVLNQRLHSVTLLSRTVERMRWLLEYAPGSHGSDPGRTERSILDRIVLEGFSATGTSREVQVELAHPTAPRRWKDSTWPAFPPPFPNSLSTVSDFDGNGTVDVMTAMPGYSADTWVFNASEGDDWNDIEVDGKVDPKLALDIAWPKGPYGPVFGWFCEGQVNEGIWELPITGGTTAGDFDGNGFADIALALPIVPKEGSGETTVPWWMFLSSGSDWIGSPKEKPALVRWLHGPVPLVVVDCAAPWRLTLSLGCRSGKYDLDEKQDVACFNEYIQAWQIGHAAADDWRTEEVPFDSYTPAKADLGNWAEDCISGELNGRSPEDIACPSLDGSGYNLISQAMSGKWEVLPWPLSGLPNGFELAGCLPGSFNDDLLQDIVCKNKSDDLWAIAVSDGTAFRVVGTSLGPKVKDPHERCTTIDLDNDGRSDVLCMEKAPSSFLVSYSRGDVLLAPEGLSPEVPASSSPDPGWCRFADFSGDTSVDIACIASDLGTSIVSEASATVPDEVIGYRTALGAETRVEFAAAASFEIEAPVIRSRLLSSIEVSPSPGDPGSRLDFSYGGHLVGRPGEPLLLFSRSSETIRNASTPQGPLLSRSETTYIPWDADGKFASVLVGVSSSLDGSDCPLAETAAEYESSRGFAAGRATLRSLEERVADDASSTRVCGPLRRRSRTTFTYNWRGQVACTEVIRGEGLDNAGLVTCSTHEESATQNPDPSALVPRPVRTGLFTRCGDLGSADDCQLGSEFDELSELSPATHFRSIGRARLEYRSKGDACGGTGTLESKTVPLSAYRVGKGGLERTLYTSSIDKHGNVACLAIAAGAPEIVEWGGLGNLPSKICSVGTGSCWEFTHSGLSSLLEDASNPGLLIELKSPGGERTRFKYDPLGRIIEVADSVRGASKLEWLSLGSPPNQRLVERLSTGAVVTSVFDGLGRVLREETQTKPGFTSVREWTFDAAGQVVASSEPYELAGSRYWTNWTYDALGRIVRMKRPGGGVTEWEYASQEIRETTPLGVVLTRREEFQPSGTLVELAQAADGRQQVLSRFRFDPIGRSTEISDPSGSLSRWAYDDLGDLTKRIEPGIGTTTFDYDADGRIEEILDANGVRTRLKYDHMGRPKLRTQGYKFEQHRTEFQYDDGPLGKGRLARVGDGATEYEWKYGQGGLLKSVTFLERKVFSKIVRRVAFDYDSVSRISRIVLPDQRQLSYLYSGSLLNSIVDSKSGYHLIEFSKYHPNGLPSVTELGNGLREESKLDEIGRVKSLVLTGGTKQIQWEFERDVDGNFLKILEDGKSKVTATYDGLDRLHTLEDDGGYQRTFIYDDLQNLVALEPLLSLEYGEGGAHPHAPTRIGDEPLDYVQGARAERVGDRRISYKLGLPTGLGRRNALLQKERLRRDALDLPYRLVGGRRESSRALGAIFETKDDCFVGIPSPFGVVGMARCGDDQFEYFHLGPGGKALATSENSAPATIRSQPLNPFAGMVRAELEALLTPWSFASEDGDLRFHGARVEAVALGEFLAPDPIYRTSDQRAGVNRFELSRRNVLRFDDPSGLSSFDGTISFSLGEVPLSLGVSNLEIGAPPLDLFRFDHSIFELQLRAFNEVRYRAFERDPDSFYRRGGGRPASIGGLRGADLVSSRTSPFPAEAALPSTAKLAANLNSLRGSVAAPLIFAAKECGGCAWDFKTEAQPYSIERLLWTNAGNYHYGYAGAAAGLSLEPLLKMGGIVQLASGALAPLVRADYWRGLAAGSYGVPLQVWPYGDDPVDQFWILRGYFDYQRFGGFPR